MIIKCVAIDDEPLALAQISEYIKKTPNLEFVGDFENGLDAVEPIEKQDVGLVFVDIDMPGINGIDLVKSLIRKPYIVFTTAYSEYAIDGFKVDALDYLLKPISYSVFLKAANKALRMKELELSYIEEVKTNSEYLFVKSEYRLVRINFNNIKYIESQHEYIKIHQTSGNDILTLMSLKNIETMLPSQFLRVHRSFIVNKEKVEVVERNTVVYDNNVRIPVGEQYKEKFQEFLSKGF
ncbi:LytR/AlgR family response regulator transcription factor [Dysgonomonas sp. ZJ709]|uniref:LytR/AlgR family response regulator transcription factor n=1 Tax=Dysgonomonas sp. ZJ709 TaxID=2709797 RepID=UPI00351A4C59